MADAKARVVLEKLGLNHFIRKFDSKNITNYFISKLTPNNFKCLAIGNHGTIVNLRVIAAFWNQGGFSHRSSRLEVFLKKRVLKSFTKFTGKHLWQILFFNKVTGLRPATLFKKKTLAQVFSCEFCKITKNTCFKNIFGQLLPLHLRY